MTYANTRERYGKRSSNRDQWDDFPYRGLTPVRVNQLQDTPYGLQIQKRSPREILEKKAENKRSFGHLLHVTKDGRKLSKSKRKEDCFKSDTEEEILLKLHYLNTIHALNQGASLEDLDPLNDMKASRLLYAKTSLKENILQIEASHIEETFLREKSMLEAKIHMHAEDEEMWRSQLLMMWSVRSPSMTMRNMSTRLRKLDGFQMSKLMSAA